MSIKRINEFPENSGSISSDDVFLFMDDPSGYKITKKISLNELITAIGITSNPSGITGASAITNIVKISQTDYDNLSSTDPDTLYIIS